MKNYELENYIKQTMEYLKEDALKAKEDYLYTTDSSKKSFQDGLLMGYYYVINLLKQQAEVFNIDLKELKLDDIDPDKDLIG